eukprot:3321829-Rhodomonas_salina.3
MQMRFELYQRCSTNYMFDQLHRVVGFGGLMRDQDSDPDPDPDPEPEPEPEEYQEKFERKTDLNEAVGVKLEASRLEPRLGAGRSAPHDLRSTIPQCHSTIPQSHSPQYHSYDQSAASTAGYSWRSTATASVAACYSLSTAAYATSVLLLLVQLHTTVSVLLLQVQLHAVIAQPHYCSSNTIFSTTAVAVPQPSIGNTDAAIRSRTLLKHITL